MEKVQISKFLLYNHTSFPKKVFFIIDMYPGFNPKVGKLNIADQ